MEGGTPEAHAYFSYHPLPLCFAEPVHWLHTACVQSSKAPERVLPALPPARPPSCVRALCCHPRSGTSSVRAGGTIH